MARAGGTSLTINRLSRVILSLSPQCGVVNGPYVLGGTGSLMRQASPSCTGFAGTNVDCQANACIMFPDQRCLRFLVRATQKANAIMTAVGQAGNKAVRYRDVSASVEIIVHPSWKLNDELALALVISAGWLESTLEHGWRLMIRVSRPYRPRLGWAQRRGWPAERTRPPLQHQA